MSKSYSAYKRASSWFGVFKDSSISSVYNGEVLKQKSKQTKDKHIVQGLSLTER